MDDLDLVGTKRVVRVDENAAADRIVHAPAQLAWLNTLPCPSGDGHDEAGMGTIDR